MWELHSVTLTFEISQIKPFQKLSTAGEEGQYLFWGIASEIIITFNCHYSSIYYLTKKIFGKIVEVEAINLVSSRRPDKLWSRPRGRRLIEDGEEKLWLLLVINN